MSDPAERLTEPLGGSRKVTRPLEQLTWHSGADWQCASCWGPIEALSTGHYRSWCSRTGRGEGFHFCCPARCQLHGT